MQVSNVTVGYERKRQPAQYESAGAKVEFSAVSSATVGEQEDYVAVARKLLGEAKTLVLTELALVPAGKSASAAIADPAPKPEVALPTLVTTDLKDAAASDIAGKGKGKGKGKGTAPAAPAAPADDIPEEINNRTAANPTGSDGPSEIPDEAAPTQVAKPAADVLTHAEVHAYISANIQAKKIDHVAVKAVTKSFGKERISEVDAKDLVAYKKAIDAKIAEQDI